MWKSSIIESLVQIVRKVPLHTWKLAEMKHFSLQPVKDQLRGWLLNVLYIHNIHFWLTITFYVFSFTLHYSSCPTGECRLWAVMMKTKAPLRDGGGRGIGGGGGAAGGQDQRHNPWNFCAISTLHTHTHSGFPQLRDGLSLAERDILLAWQLKLNFHSELGNSKNGYFAKCTIFILWIPLPRMKV